MANDMNYFEIGTPDPEASKAFYGALFDWRFGEPSMPARYAMIDENRDGLWDTSHMGAENWAIFYVQVERCARRRRPRPTARRDSGCPGNRQRDDRIRPPRRSPREPLRDLATQNGPVTNAPTIVRPPQGANRRLPSRDRRVRR